jgi:hypothetical protein
MLTQLLLKKFFKRFDDTKLTLKVFTVFGIMLTALILSCEKSENDYSNKTIDTNLIGVWKNTYSTRDLNNGITIFTDTILFNPDNSGSWYMYRFSEPESKSSFNFFTENNLIHLKFKESGDQNLLIYEVRNDSLILSGTATFTK